MINFADYLRSNREHRSAEYDLETLAGYGNVVSARTEDEIPALEADRVKPKQR